MRQAALVGELPYELLEHKSSSALDTDAVSAARDAAGGAAPPNGPFAPVLRSKGFVWLACAFGSLFTWWYSLKVAAALTAALTTSAEAPLPILIFLL